MFSSCRSRPSPFHPSPPSLRSPLPLTDKCHVTQIPSSLWRKRQCQLLSGMSYRRLEVTFHRAKAARRYSSTPVVFDDDFLFYEIYVCSCDTCWREIMHRAIESQVRDARRTAVVCDNGAEFGNAALWRLLCRTFLRKKTVMN